MTLVPLGDRVIIEVDRTETKIGSIIIPDQVQDRIAQVRGTVISIGETSDMKLKVWIKAGDKVIINKHQGVQHMEGDVEYRILRADDVLAVERKNG